MLYVDLIAKLKQRMQCVHTHAENFDQKFFNEKKTVIDGDYLHHFNMFKWWFFSFKQSAAMHNMLFNFMARNKWVD